MAYPKLLRRLFENEGEGPKLNADLLPAMDYLPLTGGRMTGVIDSDADTSPVIRRSAAYGGQLYLHTHEGMFGDSFRLRTYDGSVYYDLLGEANGDLTWSGNMTVACNLTAKGTVKGARFAANNGVNSNVDFLVNGISNGGFYLPGSLAANDAWRPVIIGGIDNPCDIRSSLWIYAATFVSTSDIRSKSEIETKHYDLSSLGTYRYRLKSDGKKHVGLIAQEVEKIIPEAVSETEDGVKRLDYNSVVAALVSEVNHLKSRVEELENGKRTA